MPSNYTQAGGEIDVSLYKTDTEVRIEVADNGPGIPVEHREKIFNRFLPDCAIPFLGYRRNGLGLAIALQAVKANGGRIEVIGRETAGSVFRVVLPEKEWNNDR